MKKLAVPAVICGALWFCGQAMAQFGGHCASTIGQYPIYCQGTGGCTGSAIIRFPIGIGGYGLEPYTVTCCGKQYTTYIHTSICWYTKVDDPDMHQRLFDLAQRGDFLIATCKGAYLPLGAALNEKPFTLKPQQLP